MNQKTLAIDLIRLDGDTQARLAVSEDAVEDYAEVVAASTIWKFPRVVVFHDGSDYWLADGFHRVLAAQRCSRGSIPCEIHKGTARDALLFAMTANDTNGLRMSAADKRRCVEILLDSGDYKTQREMASVAGVSERTVRRIVADRRPSSRTVSGSSGGNGAVADRKRITERGKSGDSDTPDRREDQGSIGGDTGGEEQSASGSDERRSPAGNAAVHAGSNPASATEFHTITSVERKKARTGIGMLRRVFADYQPANDLVHQLNEIVNSCKVVG